MRYLSFLLLISWCAISLADKKKIICYFTSWSHDRDGDGKFNISHINPNLCTHVIYAFAEITDSNRLTVSEDNFLLNDFSALLQRNSNTKSLISLVGWDSVSVTLNRLTRKLFLNNVIEFLKKYKLDGVDLDWEYPKRNEWDHMTGWVREIAERLHEEGFVISALVSASSRQASKSYNIREISRSLDFINLMTFDFHGYYENRTGLHSAARPGREDFDLEANVEASIQYWLVNMEDSKKKLMMGIPFYGSGFQLVNPKNYGVGAPSKGASKPGEYTKEPGLLAYYEICRNLATGEWKRYFSHEQMVPFAASGYGQWVGYDDRESIGNKIRMINDYELGGAMVWSIDLDDFSGRCGEKYPLLSTVYRGFFPKKNDEKKKQNEIVETTIPSFLTIDNDDEFFTTTTTTTTTDLPVFETESTTWYTSRGTKMTTKQFSPISMRPTTVWESTTTKPTHVPIINNSTRDLYDDYPVHINCKSHGNFIRHPRRCDVFYRCVFNGRRLEPVRFMCTYPLVFDTLHSVCNWVYQVKC